MKHSHFPVFLPIADKTVLVVGGGTIATRRVQSLLQFQCSVKVISLTASSTIKQLADEKHLEFIQREATESDFEDIFFCLLCTDSDEVNEKLGDIAKKKGILCNQAQDKSLSDFFFPAFVPDERFVIALIGDGNSHTQVKKMRQKLENIKDSPTD